MNRTGNFRHEPIAATLRHAPEEWQLVRSYPSRGSAMSTARSIRTGWLEAYRPAGAFDAEVRRDQDGEHVVWAQYLGNPDASQLEQARRIAVALEQEIARLRELAGTLADRWAEIAAGMETYAAAAEADDLLGHIRAERSLIMKAAARDLRWILANGQIPHWLMTNEELGEPEAAPSDGAS